MKTTITWLLILLYLSLLGYSIWIWFAFVPSHIIWNMFFADAAITCILLILNSKWVNFPK